MSVGSGWPVPGMAERTVRLEERLMALVRCAVALKDDLQVELAACQSPKVGGDQGGSQEVPVLSSDEATRNTQLPPIDQLLQTPSGAADATSLGSNSDQCLPVLDALLKNQEALQKILMNQDVLKGLVDGLLKTMTNIEERVHTIETQMGLLSRFTEELNAVDTELNWG